MLKNDNVHVLSTILWVPESGREPARRARGTGSVGEDLVCAGEEPRGAPCPATLEPRVIPSPVPPRPAPPLLPCPAVTMGSEKVSPSSPQQRAASPPSGGASKARRPASLSVGTTPPSKPSSGRPSPARSPVPKKAANGTKASTPPGKSVTSAHGPVLATEARSKVRPCGCSRRHGAGHHHPPETPKGECWSALGQHNRADLCLGASSLVYILKDLLVPLSVIMQANVVNIMCLSLFTIICFILFVS